MILIINLITNRFYCNLSIVCATTVVTAIGLALIPELIAQIKAEMNFVSGDLTMLVKEGEALYNLGEYSQAILNFDKALAIDPHYIRALTDKGLALGELGNHTGAIIYFDKALAIVINPHDVDALNSKGVALSALGNHTGAIIYFDKALAIDPHYIRALTDKGLALGKLGN